MIFNLVDIAHHYLVCTHGCTLIFIYVYTFASKLVMILDVSFQVVRGSNVSGCGTSLAILLYLSFSSAFKSYHFSPIIRFFSPRLSNALNSVTYKCTYVALHFFHVVAIYTHTHTLCTGSHIASYSVSKIEVCACINYVTYTLINGLFYI